MLLAFLCCVDAAQAGEQWVQGRIVDADGKAAPGVRVASAWTKGPSGLEALGGVETDAEGRFTILRRAGPTGLHLLAFDAEGARGAYIEVGADTLGQPVSASLQRCIPVKGDLLVAGESYYPGGAAVWLGPPRQAAPLLRVEPDRSKFSFALPPGPWEIVIQGIRTTPKRHSLPLKATDTEQDIGTIALVKHKGRVEPGALAPPIRYAEASPGVLAAMRRSHFPQRLTLYYFWASR